MAREFCPKCQAIRNMRILEQRSNETGPDGTTKDVMTRIYHCETCNSFVRSETVDAAERDPSG
jgi:hypothetical protein